MSDPIDIAAVTTNLYTLLKPLEAEDRKKVVRAALTLLGEVDVPPTGTSPRKEASLLDEGSKQFAPKVASWLQKSGLDEEILTQVFHIEGESVEIIAGDVPGKSGKEKAINAYLLTGFKNYLETGDGKFDDKSAREVCKALGCYGDTNHATYIKDRGNLIGGSKTLGWTLTAPGMKAVSELIKEIATA